MINMRSLAIALFIVVILEFIWWPHTPFWLLVTRWVITVCLFVESILVYRKQHR